MLNLILMSCKTSTLIWVSCVAVIFIVAHQQYHCPVLLSTAGQFRIRFNRCQILAIWIVYRRRPNVLMLTFCSLSIINRNNQNHTDMPWLIMTIPDWWMDLRNCALLFGLNLMIIQQLLTWFGNLTVLAQHSSTRDLALTARLFIVIRISHLTSRCECL